MDAELNIYEQIDDYLKGNLSKEAQSQFEGRLLTDAELAKTVKLQQLANEIVLTKGLADLKAKMSSDLANGKAKSNPKSYWAWILGLGITSIILSLFFYNRESIPVNKQKLVENQTQLPVSDSKTLENDVFAETKNKQSILENRRMDARDDVKTELPKQIQENPKQESVAVYGSQASRVEPKAELLAVVEMPKTDCLKKKWDFSFHSQPACSNKSDGSIEIEDKSHHEYALGNGGFGTSKSFYHLKKGLYTVSIKDENGCITTSEVEVPQKNCQEMLEFAFNPQMETWKVPIKESSKGELQIFSKNGRLAFSKQWEHGEEYEWDGKSNNGDLLGRGLYSFTIQYPNGETQQGSISITY